MMSAIRRILARARCASCASVRDRGHDVGLTLRLFCDADDQNMAMTTKKKATLVSLAIACASTIASSGCQLEQMFPEMVGEGAARLTVANTGAILRLANSDPACGFESEAAKAATVIEGEPGTMGRAVTHIENCQVQLGVEGGEPTPLGSDCNGNTSSATGMVFITGTRTLEGLVTGDPTTPIIPQTPDAVSIELSAELWGLHVFSAQSPAHLLMKEGRVDVSVGIHLARSASMGVCSVPTDEVTLKSIAVTSAVYVVNDGEGREFKVDVPSASLRAQVGAYNGEENIIGGEITVWDKAVSLGEAKPLDPSYARDAFVSSFACAADLAQPISYTCEDLRPTLADGAAKLTVSTVGNLVSVFTKDTTCGIKGADVASVWGLHAPPGTPIDVRRTLRDAVAYLEREVPKWKRENGCQGARRAGRGATFAGRLGGKAAGSASVCRCGV